MANEDYTMGTAQDDRDEDVAARQDEVAAVNAWHGIMDALPVGLADDLRVATEVMRHVGRALNHERTGEPFEHYQTALNDAAAEARHRNPLILVGRIKRLNELADAVEAKELAL